MSVTTLERRTAPTEPIPSSSREIELKFLANELDFTAIQHSARFGGGVAARSTAQRLRSTYFDTEAGDLRRHRMVLRVRRLRGRHVLTLKWEGKAGKGVFERGELEVPTRSEIPDPALFGGDIAVEIARMTEGRPLQPCFATDIRRVVRRVAAGSSEIEVAFVSGFIVSAGQKTPVREIELELKAGDPTDLFQFGLSLIEDHAVRLGFMTKADRGALLSYGIHANAVRANSPIIANQTVDQAIGAIISACLAQFVANWPAFDGPDRSESVHQMRVAMRRLRVALALFHRQFPSPAFESLRAGAKHIASVMGDARNWDVFMGLMEAGPQRAFATEPGFTPLMAEAQARRNAGYDAVGHLLAHVDTTRFVLSVEAFVARHGWRNALTGAELPRLTEGIDGFAAECLQRLHRRVRRRGRHLLDLAPEDRHGVRIALKNLRYATDFFGDVFDAPGAVRSYAQGAAHIQDALGNFNDMVMVTDLVDRLPTDDAASARAAGIIMGWFARDALASDAMLREGWRRFRKARPFWTQALGAETQS